MGSVEQGGPCNVDRVDLIPHCHGTHTETIAHILKNPTPRVSDIGLKSFFTAALITAKSVLASQSTDSYRPKFRGTDRIISGEAIENALGRIDVAEVDALILRTDGKPFDFDSGPLTPFLSIEAMQAVVKSGVNHFVLDLPSVDRLDDDGLLTSHHLFWNVPEQTSEVTKESWPEKTITEMVAIDGSIPDGFYLLNLQVAPFVADAAPSRAVIFPATLV